MGKFHTKAADCEYNEYDQRLREQYIHGLDNELMTVGMLLEPAAVKDISEATSNQKLIWAQRCGDREHKRKCWTT